MDTLLSIHKTAQILGVCEQTLREWETDKLKPIKTAGGHRRYRMSDIEAMLSTGKFWEPHYMLYYNNFEKLPDRIAVWDRIIDDRLGENYNGASINVGSSSDIKYYEKTEVENFKSPIICPIEFIIQTSSPSSIGFLNMYGENASNKLQSYHRFIESFSIDDGILCLKFQINIDSLFHSIKDFKSLPANFWDENLWTKAPRIFYGTEAVKLNEQITIREIMYRRVNA